MRGSHRAGPAPRRGTAPWLRGVASVFAVLVLVLTGSVAHASEGDPASAREAATLDVVPPAMGCAAVAAMDLAQAPGGPASVASASLTTATPGGWEACDVKGVIAPQIQFEVLLPTTTWRQRYLQTGCGGYCGNVNIAVGAAAGCVPLTEGDFVLASDNMGHYGTSAFDTTFGADPQLRIDFG